ncbi:hypothetical protein WJX73_005965 [Symbiochloris irregularis]|uniref:Imidazole glycerol phosphate synthase hisHF n=1 Tax=Symbiochloris irregularis TaxID=706552 RepID=A0AAW1NRF9_9CHLO
MQTRQSFLANFAPRQSSGSRACHVAGRLATAPIYCLSGTGLEVTLLDYGAGNVRSVRNALKRLGYSIKEVTSPQDITRAQRLVFPGVGAFEQCMGTLRRYDYVDPLRDYIQAGRPFLGICLGLHMLFEGSDENGGVEGLGIIPGRVTRFEDYPGLPVPHIGWNTLEQRRPSSLLADLDHRRVYFVHSYRATPSPGNEDWVLSTTEYGGPFVSAVQRGQAQPLDDGHSTGLARRVIACLDVRANDRGDLVVTKGDQYDVRDKGAEGGGDVRNLGLPVELAGRYFSEGADEVSFLNITGFRDFPLGDMPMLQVLRQASEGVFVPLTVGGGIREFTDAQGKFYSAVEVAAEYFRSGADKVSIGSDAVDAALQYFGSGKQKSGNTSIEQISWAYGAQAVVVSIDPRRVYVADPSATERPCVRTKLPGRNGEEYCWWQCTVKGGREGRDLDATELARAAADLGAGELLLNCIDRDGQGNGFDTELVAAVSAAVTIPVIASSGAGTPQHFSEVFHGTGAAAALAAGIFHRKEVAISAVKQHMHEEGIPTRLC